MFKCFFLIYLFYFTINKIRCNNHELVFDDFKNHPCIRDCSLKYNVPMMCVYNFTVEWYSILTRSCFNCKTNHADCFKPQCVSANGAKRAIKTVNRMIPGPTVAVCQGDFIVVSVHNMLHSFEAITIHWHGLKQRGSNHMDGVGMITQCPISPNTKFEYSFKADDVGTHFWHAHSGGQRADGIFGAIVIRSAKDINSYLYDHDLNDHIISINDWYDQTIISRYTTFLHDRDPPPTRRGNGILINGRGVDTSPAEHNTLDYQTPRAVFNVKKGERYRFRMINSGVQYCPLQVSVDKHNMTIIATDGNPINPIEVNSFYMIAGERIDFVLNAFLDVDNYWIRVKGHAMCQDAKTFQTAVLRYEGANEILPSEEVTYENSGPLIDGFTFNPFNQEVSQKENIELITVDAARSLPDDESMDFLNKIRSSPNKTFYLSLDMNLVNNSEVFNLNTYELKDEKDNWTSAQINNVTFRMPNSPLVFAEFPYFRVCRKDRIEACKNSDKLFCKCLHTLEVDLNDVVEVLVADGGSLEYNQKKNHPIHLHGQSFAVLGVEKIGERVFMEDLIELNEKGLLKKNLINPPLKDTVTVPSGGYTIFRFYADNPGIWFMHCHVEFHSEMGMSLIFKVGNSTDSKTKKPDNWPTCGDFNQPNLLKELDASDSNVSNQLHNKNISFLYSFSFLLAFIFFFDFY